MTADVQRMLIRRDPLEAVVEDAVDTALLVDAVSFAAAW
jgi:hypothetical protein